MRTAIAFAAALLPAIAANPVSRLAADELAGEVDSARPAAADSSHVRLKFMLQALGRYQVDVGAESPVPSTLHPEPLLRWTNPVSSVKDGIIALYTRGGRPDVFVEFQLHGAESAVHEFSWLTPEAVTLSRDGQTAWRPQERWVTFADFPDTPAPASRKAARLVQMRELAGRFKIVDNFGWREEDITPYELRLMARPVYRYSAPGIVDGALFVFAQGTNPEALLLLEAHDEGGRTAWKYALAPSTIYELIVTLDSRDVWHKPRFTEFNSLDGPYFVGPYVRDPTDPDLSGKMPADQAEPERARESARSRIEEP